MKIILKEKIRNLGDLGECVDVKPGYARNYLLTQSKALRATAKNMEIFEAQRKELEKLSQDKLQAAKEIAEKLAEQSFAMTAQAGEGGKLFGSIGSRDIAEYVAKSGVKVAKHQVRLPNGVIREIGEYEVVLHLHTDVDVTVKLLVTAE